MGGGNQRTARGEQGKRGDMKGVCSLFEAERGRRARATKGRGGDPLHSHLLLQS